MYTLYQYARQRLYVGTFQRDQFMNLLIKRTLKSVARSTGNRIQNNKWICLIDHLYVGNPASEFNILDDVVARVASFERTHKQSCLRITFMIAIIKAARTNSNGSDYPAVFDAFDQKFNEQEQYSWLEGVAERLQVLKTDCGHWELQRYRSVLYGTQDSHTAFQYCCRRCAQELQDDGIRTTSRHGHLILSEYAVDVHGRDSDTYIADRRTDGLTFNVQRQWWVDSDWSPYANLINGYHSSRSIGFHVIESPWFRSHRRAFGCELEVQVRSGNAEAAAGRVHDALNPSGNVGEYCFFERDGSIGTGFELVTQPAGLDVHREKFALFLKNSDMKRGMRSHEGGACGFHVHVGREYVTQSQIYRIQSFLNDVRNEALIRSIARRYENGYCKFKPQMAKFTPHGKATGDRYEALNVSNSDTIEFRIFRGSLRYESVMAALEFVNAVLTFCTPGVTSIMDFNAIGFKRWLLLPENKIDTKFLRSYLSLDANDDAEQRQAA